MNLEQGVFNKLSNILSGENRVVIPDLQRDYCWGTVNVNNKNNSLASKFIDGLIEEANKKEKSSYSYGLLYAYEYPKPFLILCDGQQRLTTLYLTLFALNCILKNSTKDYLYLANGFPRLSYEIRHTTDYFIKDLISSFRKGLIEDYTKAEWFRDEYYDDPSIKSMLETLKVLYHKINTENAELIYKFLVNNAGFVYFNIDKEENQESNGFEVREYGEKMYEIVNTRGNPMEPNEHFKAKLLSGVDDQKKRLEWTEKWEVWQDFFWRYKGNSDSADEGFNNFLSWINEIEETPETKQEKVEFQFEGEKGLIRIESYFKALFFLVEYQNEIRHFDKHANYDLLYNLKENKAIIKAEIYPALIAFCDNNYVTYFNEQYSLSNLPNSIEEIYRYMRFFHNIGKYSDAYREAIRISKKLKSKGTLDLQALLQISDNTKVLNAEEVLKVSILTFSTNSHIRKSIEQAFWQAEDDKYMKGQIKPLLDLMPHIENSLQLFDIKYFEKICANYYYAFGDQGINDTRHAFISMERFDHFSFFREGYSWGRPRFHLGAPGSIEFWQELVHKYKNFGFYMKELLNNKKINDIIVQELDKEDPYWKKLKTKLINEARNYWQWNNTARFFERDNKLFLPNGSRLGANTKEIDLS